MPDFINEYFYHCVSTDYFETTVPGLQYTVNYSSSKGLFQFDYTCTCKAFKFGCGKHCKHIEQVKNSGVHCNWQQFLEGGKPILTDGQAFCPKCGELAIVVAHAI